MKKLFLLFFSLSLFLIACEEPENSPFYKDTFRMDDFYVGTNFDKEKLGISWICDLMRDDKNIYWKQGGKKISDIKFNLSYDTRFRDVKDVGPWSDDIGTLFEDTKTTIENVKSPYFVTGLKSGTKYYFVLEAVVEGDIVAATKAFDCKIP